MIESTPYDFNKQRSCVEKKTMGEHVARRTARIIQQNQGEPVGEIRAYPCQYGAHWHVGHVAMNFVEVDRTIILPDPEPADISLEEMQEWAESCRQSA